MKAIKIKVLTIFFVYLFLSCFIIEQFLNERKTTVSLQIGSKKGGITKNTDMNVIPGLKIREGAFVDAYTGPTQQGFKAGVHFCHNLKKNHLETGVDYMYNHQTFNFNDAVDNYNGIRKLDVS